MNKDLRLRISLFKGDMVSQLFFVLSVFFLGVAMLAFNRELGTPLVWQTILFVTSVIGMSLAYYYKLVYTLAFSLIGLIVWWGVQAEQWLDVKDIKASVIFAGLILIMLIWYALGRLHEGYKKYTRFALVYLVFGTVSITGVLFFLSTRPGIEFLSEMTEGVLVFASWQVSFLLLIFVLVFAGLLMYTFSKKLISIFEVLALAGLATLFIVMVFLPQQGLFEDGVRPYYDRDLSGLGLLWALLFNILIFFEILGLMLLGYLRREKWFINLGVIFMFLLILIKYFGWFFSFLDKSIFFISAGILLFVVGWFMEKGRRYMLASIKKDEVL